MNETECDWTGWGKGGMESSAGPRDHQTVRPGIFGNGFGHGHGGGKGRGKHRFWAWAAGQDEDPGISWTGEGISGVQFAHIELVRPLSL